MSQLTKQQRNEIYKKALELYSPEDKVYNLLCCCIIRAIEDLGKDHFVYTNCATFPEFFVFKPETKLITGDDSLGNPRFNMWWTGNDTASRLNCINTCIAQTEEVMVEKKPWWKFW